MSSSPEIAIIGVGLHPFGRYDDRSALDMGAVAIDRALRDAGIDWKQVQSLYAGVHQLRGTAGDRQVQGGPQVALAQLYGAPGTAAVAILSR